MNEKEAVKLFLDRGFQLSKDALPLVSENPEFILKSLNLITPRPFIITTEHVKKILQKQETPKIKLIEEFSQLKKPINVNDYFRDLLNVFENAKSVLENNKSLDKLISINKITEKTNEFSTIGMVKEKTENSMVLEDTTGEIQIFFSDDTKIKANEIEFDDIIGIKCRRKDGKYYAMQIVFSEAPFQVDVKKSPKDAILVFSIDDYENLTKNFDSDSTIHFSITNDSDKMHFFEIGGIKILSIPRSCFKKEQKSDIFKNFIKKRMISNLTVTPSSYFFLEEMPNIILSNIPPTVYSNYKGTTIISNTEKDRIFLVNLKSREVKEKRL